MARRSFRVTVDGENFNVEVEELKTRRDAPDNKKTGKETETIEKEKQTPAAEIKKESEEKARTASAEVNEKTKTPPAEETKSSTGKVVEAPMPGSIIDVKVKEGDMVNKEDVLLILEAMKMENEVTSPVSGKVAQVKVAKGSSVNSKDPLVVIEE